MRDKVKRVKDFWNRMARGAEDEVSALDRTIESLKIDIDYVVRTIPWDIEFKVLDLCCGNGLLSFAIAEKVRIVTGLDNSEVLLHMGNILLKERRVSNIDFVMGDAVSLPFKDNSFDAVLCYDAFHYFPDYDYAGGVIKEILRVAKTDGTVLIGKVPSRNSVGYYLWNTIRSGEKGQGTPLPAKRGERGFSERMQLLFRRFSGKKVDSDEWLWYRKEIFQSLKGEKFREIRFFPSRSSGIMNYRFDVLISNRLIEISA